jgi:hypothetical protein
VFAERRKASQLVSHSNEPAEIVGSKNTVKLEG